MVGKVKKKKSKVRILVSFLLIAVIASFTYKSIISLERQYLLEKNSGSRTMPVPSLKKTPDYAAHISLESLNSPHAILIRLKDHAVLMQKNSAGKIYPASLTKMMTAIVAIENLPDMHQRIKLPKSIFQKLYKADAAMAGFQPDEEVMAIDLAYGALLPSGAECCIGLSRQIAGSEKNFVNMMNQKASYLGMNNTHFENATGLHDKNHYTTVKDMSILLSYALQNDTFREIFTSSRYTVHPTNKHPDGITFYSTMFKELKYRGITGGKILGGKTGYTDEAGLCLASFAEEGKQEYILVTAGAKGDNKSEQYNITDALSVYNSLGEK
ncbi:MAG TPA: D-alanyl-D-alanine carboxypeptidase [Clostridiaceae bacterium]|nr:D-alanyl-D-alanine carboxypeptidase [Clostridiaceae bacterium]